MAEQENHTKKETHESKLVFQELKENPMRTLNEAFALMTVIPLLVFVYVLVTELFDLDILVGKIGLILAITIIVSFSGYYAAYLVVNKIMKKIIHYAVVAKDSDEMKSMLVATVAHELKNPIAILKSNIYNLVEGLAGTVSEKQKHILDVCSDVLQRMTRLVLGHLDLYKIEAGLVDLEIEECDLVKLAEDQIEEMKAQIEEKKMSLVSTFPKEPLTAWVDPGKTIQVVHNIVGNAIKYTQDEGTIKITLSSSDGFARFECADNGQGISAEKLPKIFDKFERIDRSKEGTGLGLAIAKDLVELQKGRITVESTEGAGATFTVIMPLDLREYQKEQAAKKAQAAKK